jgi:hypothetical protein
MLSKSYIKSYVSITFKSYIKSYKSHMNLINFAGTIAADININYIQT